MQKRFTLHRWRTKSSAEVIGGEPAQGLLGDSRPRRQVKHHGVPLEPGEGETAETVEALAAGVITLRGSACSNFS
jgi:hypothetical protein